MDAIAVVSYSYTGVSRRVAGLLASHHGWPIGEVRDATPRRGALGDVRCVLDSLLRRRPEIRYDGPDPEWFRTVVIVSPLWAWRLAGPMRSFVAQHHDRMRRVAQVTTMNAGGATNAIAEVAALLGRPPVLTAQFTAREIEDGTGTGRLLRFGDALVAAPAHADLTS
jgi:flavodoxin